MPLPPSPSARRPGLPRLALLACALAVLAATAPTAARAEPEVAVSAFGTLGWTQSDREFHYQRSIDRNGTFNRDSLLGGQLDLRLNGHWSATVQAKLAPSDTDANAWTARTSWAFLGWRPDDDWLLRAGRLRVPLYMHSETLDVGHTHDFARLPVEMYAVTPTNDFDGLYITRSWSLGQGELSADAYAGRTDSQTRLWFRDGLGSQLPAGANIVEARTRLQGLALTWRKPGTQLRGSLMHTSSRRRDGIGVPSSIPYQPLGPGLGYWVVDEQLGAGLERRDSVRNVLASVGAEVELGQGWRVAAEAVRNAQYDTPLGLDATAGYVAVFKNLGAATPYVYAARLLSKSDGFLWWDRLTGSPLPSGAVPGADQINAVQRLTAESCWLSEQRTLAIGSAWALGPALKLKGEFSRTFIGRHSRLVDTPAGQDDVQHTRIDVLSVNLNFAF